MLKKINKIDFNQFVGKNANIKCIFGKSNMLKAYCNTILFDNRIRQEYNEEIECFSTSLAHLQRGDVFIFEDEAKNKDVKIKDFNVFVGKIEEKKYTMMFINNNNKGLEYLDNRTSTDINQNIIVIK